MFCFYRFISKTVERLTVQDARPSPSSASAAAHVFSGEWFLALHYSCMKPPNEADSGTHVFAFNVFAFWLKYDMRSFPGAGGSQNQGWLSDVSCRAQCTRGPWGSWVSSAMSSEGSVLFICSHTLTQDRFARAVLPHFHSNGPNFWAGQSRNPGLYLKMHPFQCPPDPLFSFSLPFAHSVFLTTIPHSHHYPKTSSYTHIPL